MPEKKNSSVQTELQKRNMLRVSNQEANAITRECIETALLRLMEKKAFAEISIQDIITVAGVSRSSYYRNYESKEDILTQYIRMINDSLSSVLKQYDAIRETKAAWLALLQAAVPFASKYRLLLQAGFGEKLTLEFAGAMNESVDPSDHALYYSNCYWAGAISTVLSEWIRNGMDVPPVALAEVGANLMTSGIRTVLEYGNRCD